MQQETSNFSIVSLILGFHWMDYYRSCYVTWFLSSTKPVAWKLGNWWKCVCVFTGLNLLGSAGCSTQEFNTLCTLCFSVYMCLLKGYPFTCCHIWIVRLYDYGCSCRTSWGWSASTSFACNVWGAQIYHFGGYVRSTPRVMDAGYSSQAAAKSETLVFYAHMLCFSSCHGCWLTA